MQHTSKIRTRIIMKKKSLETELEIIWQIAHRFLQERRDHAMFVAKDGTLKYEQFFKVYIGKY